MSLVRSLSVTPQAKLDAASIDTANAALTNGSLTFEETAGNKDQGVRSSVSFVAGNKFYFELFANNVPSSDASGFGVGTSAAVVNGAITATSFLGGSNNVGIGYWNSGRVYINNAFTTTVSYTSGDTISMAVDRTNNKIWWRKNGGLWNNSATDNPATNVGGFSISFIPDPIYVWIDHEVVGHKATVNFGPNFSFSVPSGFSALTSAAVSMSADGNPIIGYQNVVAATNVSSTTAADGFPVQNLASPYTNSYWQSGVNTGSEYVTVDFTYSGNVDYLAIARHSLGGNVLVSVYGDGSVLVPSTNLNNDDTVTIFQWPPVMLSQVKLRIDFAGDDFAQIAAMYVGKLLICQRSIKLDRHQPVNLNFKNSIIGGRTAVNPIGNLRLNRKTVSTAAFDHFEADWYRTYFQPFALAAQNTPFFFAWNPIEQPREVAYAWLTKDVQPAVHPITQRIMANIQMEGWA